jgi:hypothetical protein
MTSALPRWPSVNIRYGTADTAPGNGQRCRSHVEALEQARAVGRVYFRRSSWVALSDGPKQYGTLGSTSTKFQPPSRPLEFSQDL